MTKNTHHWYTKFKQGGIIIKKITSVLLVLSILLSLCSIVASAQETLVVTVANDLHYNTAYTGTVTKKNNINADFYHVGSSTRMPDEAYAIIKAFLADAAANESRYVLMPGDFTEAGKPEEVAGITALLREFEQTTGKEIYVITGNHDLFNSSIAQFKEDYAEFGYNEAVAVDANSASYAVDLSDEYRLIAIDSCVPGEGRHGIDETRLQWIAEQGEKAKADGKKLIGMHHHNLLEHVVFSNIIQPNGVVIAKVANAADVYAKAGIKYIFTGHTHDHDIASYKAADGTVIYDAVTGSLNAFGCLYRVVSFGKDVRFETRGVKKVDTSLFPEGITENALALAASNFPAYQEISTDLSYSIVFNSYTTAKGLKSFLKLEDDEMNAIIDKIGNKLNEALNMPLLQKNETQEGKSIASLAAQYDVIIPETDYKNMIDLAVTLYQAHNMGDENYPAYSDEVVILTRGLAAVLNYALADVNAAEYTKVLSFACELLGLDISIDFLAYAGSSVERFKGTELLLTTAILPLLVEFTTDTAPADCNTTLSGYNEMVENEEQSFFEQIINFFKMLFDAVRTFFALFY